MVLQVTREEDSHGTSDSVVPESEVDANEHLKAGKYWDHGSQVIRIISVLVKQAGVNQDGQVVEKNEAHEVNQSPDE